MDTGADPVSAELPTSVQESTAAWLRRFFSLEDALRRINGDSVPQRKLWAIHAILKHTEELEIHRLRGAAENRVYLHPEGHREAVYDARGTLVTDDVNKGSFNYFHPTRDPLRHFTFDIVPWILCGQTPEDPTSLEERVHAYSADVFAGAKRALAAAKEGGYKRRAPGLTQTGTREGIAIFMTAMQSQEGEDLADLFEVDEDLSEERIARAVEGLENGLRDIFTRAQRANP